MAGACICPVHARCLDAPNRKMKTRSSYSVLLYVMFGFQFVLPVDRTFSANVVGWGFDDAGQIDVPTNLTDAIAVAAGLKHSLAVRSTGLVIGWGDNSSSQIQI